MKRSISTAALAATCTLLLTAPAHAGPDKSGPLVRALQDELKRTMTLALPGMAKPYFASYLVLDVRQLNVAGEFGGLIMSHRRRGRVMRTDLRVGSYKFDNTNFLGMGSGGITTGLVVDDDYDALRRQVWLATDRAYKAAARGMAQKRAALANQPKADDDPPDFARVPKLSVAVPGDPALPDRAPYEQLVRELTAQFLAYPEVQEGYVILSISVIRRTFVSSEGTFFSEPRTVAHFAVAAGAQAVDGMPLSHWATRTVPLGPELLQKGVLQADVRRVLEQLRALRKAPKLARDYSGPVLFEGAAAGQLLSRVLLRNLAGTPAPKSKGGRVGQANELEGKLGKQVLPAGFRVLDDPTLAKYKGLQLLGGYLIDDQGVRAQKVLLIDRGKLKGRLMSRTPSKKFPASNGHGRAALYGPVPGGPSNVIVTARRGARRKQLLRKLLAAAKKDGEDHAIVLKGLANPMVTGRLSGLDRSSYAARAGSVLAYRVDKGGKETLVRGATLKHMRIKQLKRIVAAGKQLGVYHHLGQYRYAAGGAYAVVPISIVTPSLLLTDVEVNKVKGGKGTAPLLPRPGK